MVGGFCLNFEKEIADPQAATATVGLFAVCG